MQKKSSAYKLLHSLELDCIVNKQGPQKNMLNAGVEPAIVCSFVVFFFFINTKLPFAFSVIILFEGGNFPIPIFLQASNIHICYLLHQQAILKIYM